MFSSLFCLTALCSVLRLLKIIHKNFLCADSYTGLQLYQDFSRKRISITGRIVNLKYFKLKRSCYCRRNSSAPIVNLVLSVLQSARPFFLQTLKNVCIKLVDCLINSKCSSVYSEVILFSSKASVHVVQPKQHMQSSVCIQSSSYIVYIACIFSSVS